MRLPRESIHPSVWSARDRYFTRSMGGEATSPIEAQISADRQQLWIRQNGVAFTAGLVLFFAAVFALAEAKHSMSKPFFVAAILGLMAVWGLAVTLSTRGSRKYLDSAELRMLMPALQLTPIQAAYGEALLALADLKLDAEAEKEILGQFNALLDEEARLLALREREGGNTSAAVLAERDSLRVRLDATTDPVTREALAQSLDICEGRVATAHELSMVGERVDAQLEMIAQSMRNFRDTLQRLRSAPSQSSVGLNLTPIRDTIQQAQQHARALEAAVNEVHGLGI